METLGRWDTLRIESRSHSSLNFFNVWLIGLVGLSEFDNLGPASPIKSIYNLLGLSTQNILYN